MELERTFEKGKGRIENIPIKKILAGQFDLVSFFHSMFTTTIFLQCRFTHINFKNRKKPIDYIIPKLLWIIFYCSIGFVIVVIQYNKCRAAAASPVSGEQIDLNNQSTLPARHSSV